MLLSDADLIAEITAGRLRVTPLDLAEIQPSSIDVRLASEFRIFGDRYPRINPREEQRGLMLPYEVPDGGHFVLQPGQFALGSTVETIAVGSTLAARIEGKSSLARLGLLLHVTAGFIDPGFTGRITLELVNLAPKPLILWPGMRIGQLCVFQLSSRPDRLYGTTACRSRYQGQDGPTPSRAYLDWVQPALTP